jgi:hypothetical protein
LLKIQCQPLHKKPIDLTTYSVASNNALHQNLPYGTVKHGVFMSENEGSLDGDFSADEVAEFESESGAPESAIPSNEELAANPEKLQELIEEFELKVNGKTVKEKINMNDKARIQKALQMEKAAQESFQKAANSQKQIAAMEAEMDQFLQMLKSDPMKILSNPALGLKLEDMADKILAQKIEEASKSPEQIELEQARAKLEQYEKKIKEEETARQNAERQRMESEAEAHIQGEIMEAIDSGSLPKSPYIINKMAQLASIAFENGVDISMKDLAPIVNKMYKRDMKEMMGSMKDDEIEELVSSDRIKAIRNARIQAARGKMAAATKVVDTGAKAPIKKDAPTIRRRLDSDW